MSPAYLTPENVALVTAIEGDSTLAGLLAGAKVYGGIAPEGSPFNYLTLSAMSEEERNLFNKNGTVSKITLSIWTRDPAGDATDMAITRIWGALYNLLHNRKLALSTGRMISGKLHMVLTGSGDPADIFIRRGTVEYRMRACS